MSVIVGIGELNTDILMEDENVLINGGGSTWNKLAYLSKSRHKTYAIGFCGKDYFGKLTVDSLKEFGVNIDYVKYIDDFETRSFFQVRDGKGFKTTNTCPKCGFVHKASYNSIYKNFLKCIQNNKVDLIVSDRLTKTELVCFEHAKQVNIPVYLDLGKVGGLRYLSKLQIYDKLANKIDYLQIGKELYTFLLNKFKLLSIDQLVLHLGCKMIIVTDESRDIKYTYVLDDIWLNGSYSFDSIEPVDSVGAGDAFGAQLINQLLECSQDLESLNQLKGMIEKASINGITAIKTIGARGYFQEYLNLTLDNNVVGRCQICHKSTRDVSVTKMKKTSVNIKYLLDKVSRANESDALREVEDMFNSLSGNVACIGSGGSTAVAAHLSKIINKQKNVFSMSFLPREFLINGFGKFDIVILISYSGFTPDIYEVYKSVIEEKYHKVFLITKERPVELNDKYKLAKIISYNSAKTLTSKERGFLAFEGVISPISIFERLSYDENGQNYGDFLDYLFSRWNNYFKKCVEIKEINFKNTDTIDVFVDSVSASYVIDLESKFIESGFSRVTVHEKKDFSHGRFNIPFYHPSNFMIYYKTNSLSKYESRLLTYLKKTYPSKVIILESDFNDYRFDFDMLVANIFLVRYISDEIDRDLSKPKYNKEAIKLYKYRGGLIN